MLPERDAQSSFWNGKDSVARRIFPHILPEPGKEDGPDENPSAGGEDRVRHFTMFAALYQLVLSSVEQRTGLEKSSPNVLKISSAALAYKEKASSSERKAAIFTEMAGLLYEFKSTLNLSSLPLPGRDRDKIKSGLFDLTAWRDLLVNTKAIKFSRLLRRCVELPATILRGEEKLLEQLKDPNLSFFKVRPLMEGIIPFPKATLNS